MQKFEAGGTIFEIPLKYIPEDSLLHTMIHTGVGSRTDIIHLESTKYDFMNIHEYLTENVYPSDLKLMDYFMLNYRQEYFTAVEEENRMRSTMYTDEGEWIRKDMYYNLIKIDREKWESLVIRRPKNPHLLFQGLELEKQTWEEIQLQLDTANLKPNVLVAGGFVFSALFGTKANDIDLFIYDITERKANRVLEDMLKGINISITRSVNAITFGERQVILRLYSTISEVLHGFDVDCCSIGYDGENIWCTKRAWFALQYGMNSFSFEYLSPSYEYRLAKYGMRGMAVYVNEFNVNKVDHDMLRKRFEQTLRRNPHTGMTFTKYKEIPMRTMGLDILVYLDYQANIREYRTKTKQAISKLANTFSDYDDSKLGAPIYLGDFLYYMETTTELYPEIAEKYIPLLYMVNMHEVRINQIFPYKRFRCISGYPSEVLVIDSALYKLLECVSTCELSQRVTWKTTKPGEQMTGTFHRKVLRDVNIWFDGLYYRQ